MSKSGYFNGLEPPPDNAPKPSDESDDMDMVELWPTDAHLRADGLRSATFELTVVAAREDMEGLESTVFEGLKDILAQVQETGPRAMARLTIGKKAA